MRLYFESGLDLNYEITNTGSIDMALGLAPDLQFATRRLIG